MAYLAAPEVAAAAETATAGSAGAGVTAGTAKLAARRKASSTGPAGARSTASRRPSRQQPADGDEGQGDEGQGDGGGGRGAWSRAGDASRSIVTVEAPQPVETGAGVLLGLILWAIVINFLRGGPAQAKGWILAKLINRTYGGKKDSNVKPPATAAKPSGPVTA